VELGFVDVGCKPRECIRCVFLPTDSFIFLVNPIDGHAGLESRMVGGEGMAGSRSCQASKPRLCTP
jgi:hypothetical protein